jgi:hypothetical protein
MPHSPKPIGDQIDRATITVTRTNHGLTTTVTMCITRAGYWFREIQAGRTAEFCKTNHCDSIALQG